MEIKLLTLNTWGLKYVSKHRRERLRAIADRLSTSSYDVVALQEIWCQEDWDYLDQVCTAFPYRRRFSSGIISGPGLCILSKVPIKKTWLYRFPINGRPSAFWRGDWFVGKSIAVTILEGGIAILNSHMHAPYSLEGDAAYECHRVCQAWDFAQLAKLLGKAGYEVVVVGDLNSRPGSLPHKFLTLETGLSDSWTQVHDDVGLEELKKLTPQEQVDAGCTCDSRLNTWRAYLPPTKACRLDYALVSEGLRAKHAEVVFTEVTPFGSYSDHFGYSVHLQTTTPHTKLTNKVERLDYHSDFLDLLDEYSETAQWQQSWRLYHFWISILIVIGLAVMSPWLPAWAAVIWVLLSFIIGGTGLIDGMIGFLFGHYELRALDEVKMEVGDARAALLTGTI